MTEPMTPARLKFFRDWVDGKWPDGSPHVPDGSESWTRELVGEIERLLTELKWQIEMRDIYCIATTEFRRRADGYREAAMRLRDALGGKRLVREVLRKLEGERDQFQQRAEVAERICVEMWEAPAREWHIEPVKAMRERQR